MTLAQSAVTASPLAILSSLIIGMTPARRMSGRLFRIRHVSADADPVLPNELSGGDEFSLTSGVLREPEFATPAPSAQDEQTAPPVAPKKPVASMIEDPAEAASAAPAVSSARLRWPIRDGVSSWAGAAMTSILAFAAMAASAFVAADLAPQQTPSAFERAAIHAGAPTAR